MAAPRTPTEQVAHVIRLHHRGVICPTEMWMNIADALTPTTANSVLESLPEDVKLQLREVWLERPPAAYVRHTGAELQAVCVQVVQWCEASGPLDRPLEPDGLIRVCVNNGVVAEWRAGEES